MNSDGDLENVKLSLLNKDIVENIKFGFILKNNDYIIYNASSFYQDIKFKSDEIRIREKERAFLLTKLGLRVFCFAEALLKSDLEYFPVGQST